MTIWFELDKIGREILMHLLPHGDVAAKLATDEDRATHAVAYREFKNPPKSEPMVEEPGYRGTLRSGEPIADHEVAAPHPAHKAPVRRSRRKQSVDKPLVHKQPVHAALRAGRPRKK